jgi:predicted nucleic acid-binding protein
MSQRPVTPPRARPGSPPPPPGTTDLDGPSGQTLRVVADTNALLRRDYRLPLAASAEAGDLEVCWSAWIRDEIRQVVWRSAMEQLDRRVRAGIRPEERFPIMREAIESATDRLDLQIAFLEARFRTGPDVSVPDDALPDVKDADDRPVIELARSVGAPYLLTLDERHLPHGAVIGGVQCWHPDTFLTLFYTQRPDAYLRAIAIIRTLPEAVTSRILP